MSTKPPGILQPLRVRVRRMQFVVGLGFMSLVLGAMFSGSLTVRLVERVRDLPDALRILIAVGLENLWVLAMLPVLCYGAARILELRPLSTALGAAFSGQAFVIALDFVRDGFEGVWTGWVPSTLRAFAFSSGVFFSYRAVMKGRAAAARSASQAAAQAEARKGEYMEFLREAERGAEKSAQREAERTAVAASAGGPAVAVAPDGGAPSSEGAVSAVAPAAVSAVPAEAPVAVSAVPAEAPVVAAAPVEPAAPAASAAPAEETKSSTGS